MIANSATPYPPGAPHRFTLNDLRVQNTVPDAPSSTSAMTVAVVGSAVVLAIGAFAWVDPLHLHLLRQPKLPRNGSIRPSRENLRSTTQSQELAAPLAPVPATKSAEAPIAPAPEARGPQPPAPVVQPRAASISRNPSAIQRPDKDQYKGRQGSTNEKMASLTLTKPEEKATPPVSLPSRRKRRTRQVPEGR